MDLIIDEYGDLVPIEDYREDGKCSSYITNLELYIQDYMEAHKLEKLTINIVKA